MKIDFSTILNFAIAGVIVAVVAPYIVSMLPGGSVNGFESDDQ